MFRRVFGVLFGILIAWFFVPYALADNSHLVINSYQVSGAKGTTDEFIEIYNPTGSKINIKGWQLAKKTAGGTKSELVFAFGMVEINPGESILVGHKDSAIVPDVYYDLKTDGTSNSVSEDNTILLYSDAGRTVIDKVGFGKAGEYEAKPAPTAGKEIWQRTNGADSDNNFNDFKKGISSSAKDYSGICLSEVMPKPAEGEEWIELYNSEMTKDIGGLIIADIAGATKQFKVPEGTQIAEGGYLVIYKKDTGITLNDDGDGVALIDGTGKVFDETGNLGPASSGVSFAFDGSSWKPTSKPTPGGANIMGTPEKAITSKKRTTTSPTASTKGVMPTAEVLGSTDQAQKTNIFGNRASGNPADRLIGSILIALAILGAVAYTIFVNREKLSEAFINERTKYDRAWDRVREKLKRR
jgi:hypothetical protein